MVTFHWVTVESLPEWQRFKWTVKWCEASVSISPHTTVPRRSINQTHQKTLRELWRTGSKKNSKDHWKGSSTQPKKGALFLQNLYHVKAIVKAPFIHQYMMCIQSLFPKWGVAWDGGLKTWCCHSPGSLCSPASFMATWKASRLPCSCSSGPQTTASCDHMPSTRFTASLAKPSPPPVMKSCNPTPRSWRSLCCLKTTWEPCECSHTFISHLSIFFFPHFHW